MYRHLRRSFLFLVVLMLLAASAPPLTQAQSYALTVYNDPGYAGTWCYSNSPMTANIAAICNDQISSILLSAGWSIRAYRDQNQGGPSVCFNRSDANLNDNTFEDGSPADNTISSFTLYNQAWCAGSPTPAYPLEVYTDPNYGGSFCYSSQSQTANIHVSCNDLISAVLLRAGWSLRVYGDQNQGGSRGCLAGSDGNLTDNTFFDGSSMNDAISSFVLYNQGNCANAAPHIPAPSGPANGSVLNNPAVVLSWSDPGDPDNWPRTIRDYSAEIWKSDNSWSATLNWQFGNSWSLSVPSNGTYYWHVQSGDGWAGSGWSGTWSFSVNTGIPMGNLNGRVTAAGSGAPISGARVVLGPYVTQTGSDGVYRFAGVQATTYNFSVTKDGYASHQSAASVVANASSAKDVQLTARSTEPNGLTFPLSARLNNGTGGPVNAYYDLDRGPQRIYDYAHPVGSQVNINSRSYIAPWPGNLWRLGLAYNGHDGTDFHGLLNNTTVIAAAPGYIVAYRDTDPNCVPSSGLNCKLQGNHVIMRHTDVKGRVVYAYYWHLQAGTIPAAIKQAAGKNILIPRGTALGRVGMSGNTTGPHLHFGVGSELWKNAFDPYTQGLWAPGTVAAIAMNQRTPGLVSLLDGDQAPTAVFNTSVIVAKPGDTMTFDASASADTDGSIVQYLWDLGDGTQLQGLNIGYAYTQTGTYYVFLTTVDDQGNATLSDPVAITVNAAAGTPDLDIVPPQGSLDSVEGNFTAAPAVTLQMTLDAGENPATTSVRFSTDGQSYGNWEPFAAQKTMVLSDTDGINPILVEFADEAGNISSPAMVTVIRDTTPPEVTLSQPISDTNALGQVAFAWNITDAGVVMHGTPTVEYMLLGVDPEWRPADTEPFALYSGLSDGTYTFRVRVTDQAGNHSSEEITAVVAAPHGSVYLPLVLR